MGIAPGGPNPLPLVLQTSGGTTGLPRPMLYSPHDREIMAILGARRYAMQGMRPGDMVLVAFSLGLVEWRFRQSRDPLEIYGRRAGDDRQRRHHADAAADRDLQGLGDQCGAGVPVLSAPPGAGGARRDGDRRARLSKLRMVGSHIGVEDRKTIEELWGAPCYDSYGTHENGTLATECKFQNGMHINDDCFRARDRRSGDRQGPARRRARQHPHHHAVPRQRAADPLQHQRHFILYAGYGGVPLRLHASGG